LDDSLKEWLPPGHLAVTSAGLSDASWVKSIRAHRRASVSGRVLSKENWLSSFSLASADEEFTLDSGYLLERLKNKAYCGISTF
jgi:hypothetical protein